jgi:hypothetical protein
MPSTNYNELSLLHAGTGKPSALPPSAYRYLFMDVIYTLSYKPA